jgi:hypothetical protein
VIAFAVTAAIASRAAAEPTGIVVVTGRAAAHERTVIEGAIITAVRRASWPLSNQLFTPKEIDEITKCLRDDRPWPCLSPLMAPKGVGRIVVAAANPQAGAPGKLTIIGELVVAGDGAAVVSQQSCDGCDDVGLTVVAQRLTDVLLHDLAVRSEQTILSVQTVPSGATVLLDGQSIGITNASGTVNQMTYAGPHKLTVQRIGYVFEERTVNLSAGRTTMIPVALRPERAAARAGPPLTPLVIAGAGAAGVVVGGVLLYVGQQDGPDVKWRYTRATALGVVVGIAGIAAVGAGTYLWLNPATPSGLIIGTSSGGAVIGWAGTF